jgi:hypothetical protein
MKENIIYLKVTTQGNKMKGIPKESNKEAEVIRSTSCSKIIATKVYRSQRKTQRSI